MFLGQKFSTGMPERLLPLMFLPGSSHRLYLPVPLNSSYSPFTFQETHEATKGAVRWKSALHKQECRENTD